MEYILQNASSKQMSGLCYKQQSHSALVFSPEGPAGDKIAWVIKLHG